MKIAFLACADTLPASPTRRPDAFEHDYQISALRAGLAQIKGHERYEGFVEALDRRLHKGQSFLHEIPDDIPV